MNTTVNLLGLLNVSDEQRGDSSNEQRGDASNEQRGDVSNEQRGDASNEQRGDVSNEQIGDVSNEQRGDASNEQRGDASNEQINVSNELRGDAQPLLTAAESANIGVFDFLLSQGYNASAVDDDNNNVLHWACVGGNLDMVKHIVSLGNIDKESPGFQKLTPLLTAAGYGHIAVLDFLLCQGCNVSAVDEQNNTVLHLACFGGHLHMVKHIVSLRIVEIESPGFHKWTPLMYAAYYGQVEAFDFLLSQGCNVSAVDGNNSTVLHLACVGGKLDMVKHIIYLGVIHKESPGLCKRTPLLTAAESGNIDMFDFLLSQGCDVSAVDEQNNTVLNLACVEGKLDMVKHIVSLGIIEIESQVLCKRSPLMTVAELGHIDLFDFLLSQGCDASAVDEQTNTVLHLACFGGHLHMVKHIMALGTIDKESPGLCKRTPLMTAAFYGYIDVFDFLLSQGCSVSAVDEDNETVPHCACIGGKLDMVEHIVSLRNVAIESPGFHKWTPLMYAAAHGQIEVFDFLLSQGCNVSAGNEQTDNVLHCACYGEHLHMVKHIVALGIIDKERPGLCQKTPMMIAADLGHIDMCDFLASQGCDVSTVYEDKDSPRHWTCTVS